MDLRPDIAQRIVERVGANLDRGVRVTDARGYILAATDPALVHTYLTVQPSGPPTTSEFGDPETQTLHLPLSYADQYAGTLVLEGQSVHDQQNAAMARMLAELIVHQMMVIDELPRQARLRDKFVSDLVHGNLRDGDLVVRQEAGLLGIDLELLRVVAVIDVEAITAEVVNQPLAQTSLPKVTRALRVEQRHVQLVDHARRTVANHPDDVYSFIGDRWFILLAVADRPLETTHQRIALRVRSLFHTLSAEQQVQAAGVGRYYPGWTGLARSFTDARFALETGSRLHGPGRAYCREDLGLADCIWHPEQAAKAERGRCLLATIQDEPDLLTTLEVFLAANLSPSVAAKQLHIHRHTLTYRLTKIHRLTGLDPCTFVDAAQLYAALLLRQLDRATP